MQASTTDRACKKTLKPKYFPDFFQLTLKRCKSEGALSLEKVKIRFLFVHAKTIDILLIIHYICEKMTL